MKNSLQKYSQLAIDFIAYIIVRMLVSIIQTLPLDMGKRMADFVAWVATCLLKIRHKETDENLRQIFPAATVASRDHLELEMWRHLLLMVCEIAWAQRRLHLTNWSDYVRFRDNRAVLSNLLSGRPTVSVTGHFGNFEIGGYVLGLMGFSSTTIARRLDNVFLHRWVERFRGAKGQQMVDKEGCAPQIDRHLQNGGALSLLADQHAGDKGCWVNFLGVPASSHKALALFTLTSNAPMMVSYTIRTDGKPMHFEAGCVAVADPLDDPDGVCESVTKLTQWYNDSLATAIQLAIEQYWWLHRRWRKPPARVAKRLLKEVA
ncbi:Lipid A biosynthesis lauroyl acyltransferase [Planctomycetes bacterium CA13]|uniref:Lipid A biosynthesis lauroyl acyltransferase n=1 Tax=Novipirellula herctigrandis TaxID=2527986 RepID=A0A5C5YXA7_9BACT|nr:Lipid A biosynthesis lauroyl acyltransferase [Planctomycetes bacterium CA13]